MNLYLLCGRLDGWDDDIARVLGAESAEQARRVFINSVLLMDNGYQPGERDAYVHQVDLLGTFTGDHTLQLIDGYDN